MAFLGESFGGAATIATSTTGTFKWPSTDSCCCAPSVVTLSTDGEASFLLFGFDFLPSFFAAAFAAARPIDSSRCFLISKSSFGWLFSKLLSGSMVPLTALGELPLVDLLTRMLLPGGFVALFLRTAGAFNFPVDNWRYKQAKQTISINSRFDRVRKTNSHLERNGVGVGGDNFSFGELNMQLWRLSRLVQFGATFGLLITFDGRRFWRLFFIAVSLAILKKKAITDFSFFFVYRWKYRKLRSMISSDCVARVGGCDQSSIV